MIKKLLYTILVLLGLSSCAPGTLYSWHSYENATYKYSKKATEEQQEKVLKEYDKMITKQKGTRKTVPPGMYAEYGFLLCKTGKTQEGIAFLKEEAELYPESTAYVMKIIKQFEQ